MTCMLHGDDEKRQFLRSRTDEELDQLFAVTRHDYCNNRGTPICINGLWYTSQDFAGEIDRRVYNYDVKLGD